MRLNIAGLMRSALPLAALLLLAACPNTTSYTIGGTVTGLASSPGPLSTPLILQNNGGDNLTISAIGAFTFATAVTSTSTTSATYNVTIRTQPFPQTCTVTGGRGIASSNVTSVVVSCSSSSTSAYVVNASNNNVSQYTMGANGALNTSAASSVATGATPYSIAVVPSGLYAYVANNFNGVGGNTVSEYIINSGVLTLNTTIASPTGTIGAGTNPVSVTIDPKGPYVYVVNAGSNNVSEYTIGNDGTLAKMAPATVAAVTTPYSIAVDPTGRYAYVANYGSNSVSQYKISSVDGTLSELAAPVVAGLNPSSVTVDPSGQYAYVANYFNGAGGNSVSQYKISSVDGSLSELAAPVVAGLNPISVTVDPSGQYAYVANYFNGAGGNSVSQYKISSVDGTLSELAAPVVSGLNPSSVTVDPSGQYAYVANLGDGTVSQYKIGNDGTLAAMAPATVTVGGQPISVITAR